MNSALSSYVPLSSAPTGIVARGWGWRHSGRAAWAVRGVDLVIEPGERVLLLGASGAGKSTLVQAIAGVMGGADEGDEEGVMLVGGRSARDARGTVGLVLQDPDSHAVMARVGDDVAFGCENLGVVPHEIWPRVRESLDAVGLDLPLDASTSSLSGGQKQRLALAGLLAMRPGLVLLDEPTANLDPAGVVEVRDAVERMITRTDATLVVIEHRVAVWRDLVTRVVVLGDGGAVIADGSPDVVLGAHGAALAAAGVWVPGHLPRLPTRTPGHGTALLAAEGLSIGRKSAAILHSDLFVEARSGRCLAVTGPNGAGKSTLGLTLGGLLVPRAGAVDGSALVGARPGVARQGRARPGLAWRGGGRRAANIRSPYPIEWPSRHLVSRIGSVFQDPEHQFVASTVRGELEVGAAVIGLDRGKAAARVQLLLERFRLESLALANPFSLSGGEKRRLSVATALVARPPVLILDEPTFGQDLRTWGEIVGLLRSLLDEGTAVVAITHDLELVAALADDELRMGAPA